MTWDDAEAMRSHLLRTYSRLPPPGVQRCVNVIEQPDPARHDTHCEGIATHERENSGGAWLPYCEECAKSAEGVGYMVQPYGTDLARLIADIDAADEDD